MESLEEISKGCPTLLEPEYAQNNNIHCERYPHLLVSYSVGTPKWAIKDTDKARSAILRNGKTDAKHIVCHLGKGLSRH